MSENCAYLKCKVCGRTAISATRYQPMIGKTMRWVCHICKQKGSP